ncbi:MAG TPA: 23S rRNA (adenine(2030)-N(6))-methyltransferase RlmJ [Azospirillaceae bacterium]|nr:23S rRNA (adenine(2030)-N(6))-methyltransferase RlmJ [Azospirillaceae bacterium]
MNYRHAFHAGNFADVVKHAVLTLVVERLKAKPKPFCVLDTHAGIGRYDLTSDAARRTGEHAGGIGRVLHADLPADLSPYLDAVRSLNPADASGGDGARWYPGSPCLVRALMRPGDRLVLAELHPDDAATLKREFRGDDQVAVHHMDGWLALKAHLPPRERRGLVLIDPAFEVPDEYDRLAEGLRTGHARFPSGIFLLWHPIKERPAVWRLHDAIERSGIRDVLTVEVTIWPEDTHQRLNGCGLVIVNPPWGLEEQLARTLPGVHTAFGTGTGGVRVNRLVPE